ncbi:MAG: radical SAM protein [Thermoproteota archaeon]
MVEKKSRASISDRQRKAALKAWKTMKRDRWKRGSKLTEKIENFMTVQQVSKIVHPEITLSQETKTKFANGIVSLFHKTPPDIACGKFWELRWAYGCPLDCNYCYLRGTMRGNMKPSPLKSEHVLKALDEAFANIKTPSIFNTGELSDSLMFPTLMEKIVDKFEEQSIHKVALLSKMGIRYIDFLLKKLRKQTICAWSVNAAEVAKRWEKAAANPKERIDAAALVSSIGYDTRIRIDPIFPIFEWKKHYEEIIEYLFSKLTPRRIILGTPRGLWKTIKYANEAKIDMSWANFFNEDSSWGKKLSLEQRREIYQFFIDKLTSFGYPKSKITMCKETTEMWSILGLEYAPLTCNCYGQNAYAT